MSIAYWSVKLVPGKPVSVQAPEGYVLNVNQAALVGGKEKSTFVVKVDTVAIEGDKLESVLGTLRPVSVEQFSMNLVFADDVPTSFSVASTDNSGSVYLSGYYQPGPDQEDGDEDDMDMYDDDEDEDDGEDEDDDEDDPRVVEVDEEDQPINKSDEKKKAPEAVKKAPEPVKKAPEPAKKSEPVKTTKKEESESEEDSDEDDDEVDEEFLKVR